MNEKYKRERFPNLKIKVFLPYKTLKQISDRRRLLPSGKVKERNTGGLSEELGSSEEESTASTSTEDIPEPSEDVAGKEYSRSTSKPIG